MKLPAFKYWLKPLLPASVGLGVLAIFALFVFLCVWQPWVLAFVTAGLGLYYWYLEAEHAEQEDKGDNL